MTFDLSGISLTGKEYVELGDPITLVCNATGGTQTPEEIDWFKDGDKVSLGIHGIGSARRRWATNKSAFESVHRDANGVSHVYIFICINTFVVTLLRKHIRVACAFR